MPGEGDITEGEGLKPSVTVLEGERAFKAQGPRPIGAKKKYKFVEPPGITEWIGSFFKKCLVCGIVYTLGYYQVKTKISF